MILTQSQFRLDDFMMMSLLRFLKNFKSLKLFDTIYQNVFIFVFFHHKRLTDIKRTFISLSNLRIYCVNFHISTDLFIF